jgi:mxaJ protein
MCMRFREAACVLALMGGACADDVANRQADRAVLRVCSDPNNLPFSNDRLEGFENRIASLVAEELNANLEYVWWAQRRGHIRNTLNAGLCDVVIGVPTALEIVRTTRPYYRSSYVFVTRRGAHEPASFDDPYLTDATIGVHLIGDDFANSPPAHALSARGLVQNVRGFSLFGDYRQPNPPAALIDAVSNGAIDVAVAWGPLAGYFATRSAVPLQLTRVTPDEEPPFPFVFDVSMGVARANVALHDTLDDVIGRRRGAIKEILRDFGVPLVANPQVAAP